MLLFGWGRDVIAADMPLAKAGVAQCVLTVATDASAPERHAAEELQTYLQAITGAVFTTVPPAEVGHRSAIAIGPGATRILAPEVDLAQAALGDDGIVMKTIGNHLVLTGGPGARRGTLYAVYTFLEDVCGVRWWTQDAETVPRRTSLAVPPLDVTYVPPFRYRETLYTNLTFARGNPARTRFLVRSKFNGHFNSIPADWGGSYTIIGWCHTFARLMPPKKYFKKHPEWYSEIKGKRTAHRSQLCCTNDAMIAELAKNVLAAIAKQPDAGIISVSQNDWHGKCQCERCRALDTAEGSGSASLLYCVNRVADVVHQHYPDFLVETLAYQYTRNPPKTIRPRDNVLIRLAVIERTAAQPLEHPFNGDVMADLRAWKKAAPNLFIWDYVANMRGAFTPHPNLGVFAPDVRTYVANHVRGVFFEGNHYCGNARGDFDELKVYLMAHLLWNPQADADALIDDFLHGYYGKAAPFLRQYLDLLQEKGKDTHLPSWKAGADAPWLDLEAMNRATRLFDAALAATADDPVTHSRVQRARLPLEHQWLRGYKTYRHEAEQTGKDWLGPDHIVPATDAFLDHVLAFEGRDLRTDKADSYTELAQKMRRRAKRLAELDVEPQ